MSQFIIPFGWYGGKYSHLNWMLPLLPPSNKMVDVFGGSGSVVLNYDKALVKVYNDIDPSLHCFFSAIKEHGNDVIETVRYTPFSREMYYESLENIQISEDKKAALFFLKVHQTRMKLAQRASLGLWNSSVSVDRSIGPWSNRLKRLSRVASRIDNVSVTNITALEAIKEHDGKDILLYVDPPYVHDTREKGSTRVYFQEMIVDDHKKLIDALNDCESKVAISGYAHGLYDELLEKNHWAKHEREARIIMSSPKKATRQEVLWTNYDTTTGKRL